MKRITDTTGAQWVVSRVRNANVELVNVSTGHLVIVPLSAIDIGKAIELPIPWLPNCVPFSKRPRSFLTELRALRAQSMLSKARAAKKAADRKAAKTMASTGPKKPRGGASKAALNTKLQAILSAYPPDQHAAIIAAMKGKAK